MMRSRRGQGYGIAVSGLLGCLWWPAGCVPVDPGDGGDDGGPDEGTALLVFRNQSTLSAVEVSFYAATGPLESLPDDLFVEANLITSGIGVAGTGIIQPQQFDFLDGFECSENLIIGTSGGRFLDNDTGEERGQGQARWVAASSVGFCGRAVTFTFSDEGDEFTTQVSIAP